MRKPLTLPAAGTEYRYAPQFVARSAGFQQIDEGPEEFLVQMRNNGFGCPKSVAWGGFAGQVGAVPTFDRYLPENVFFRQHPQWYALSGGVRRPGPLGQPCLTNREMRARLVRQVLKAVEESPGIREIWCGQNDNERYCECAKCCEFVQKHGNQSDLLIDCINEVAAAVAQKFPEVQIQTFAYQYTRHPPMTVRPHRNIVIRYCTIEAAATAALTDPRNRALLDDLRGWRELVPGMLIWDYVANFNHYCLPHPNWHVFAPNLRLFRDCRAISVFEQGAYDNGGAAADLPELRTYVISKLLWNPDLDEKALVREFVEGYYGTSAPQILDYIAAMTAAALAHPESPLKCVGNQDGFCRTWLDNQTLAAVWRRMYDQAEKVKNVPEYGSRMAMAVMPVTIALLERPELLSPAPESRLPELKHVNAMELVKFCKKHFADAGIQKMAENSLPVWMWLLKQSGRYTPDFKPPFPNDGGRPGWLSGKGQFLGWNVERLGPLMGHDEQRQVALRADAAAVDGKAVWMPTSHHEWFVQMGVPVPGVYDIYVEARCDPAKPVVTGNVMSIGIYPGKLRKLIDGSEIAGAKYHRVYLGSCDLSDVRYIYCAPEINGTASGIWLDRLILSPAGNKQTPSR